MKPEQAKPHNLEHFAKLVNQGHSIRAFTASETAQIARQFAASLMCAPECNTDEFERWQHLFDEWQK